MRNTEIKEVKEYCWGSVVTVLEDENTRTMITAKAGYLTLAFVLTNVLSFVVGFILGRI